MRYEIYMPAGHVDFMGEIPVAACETMRDMLHYVFVYHNARTEGFAKFLPNAEGPIYVRERKPLT